MTKIAKARLGSSARTCQSIDDSVFSPTPSLAATNGSPTAVGLIVLENKATEALRHWILHDHPSAHHAWSRAQPNLVVGGWLPISLVPLEPQYCTEGIVATRATDRDLRSCENH